jgi:hypothetical protein
MHASKGTEVVCVETAAPSAYPIHPTTITTKPSATAAHLWNVEWRLQQRAAVDHHTVYPQCVRQHAAAAVPCGVTAWQGRAHHCVSTQLAQLLQ